jgi:MtN3 and saliva related transmembrane protein
MNGTIVNIIGYIATGIVGFSLVPQVYKTFSAKSAGDLSTPSLICQNIANILFVIYGYYINSFPVILCNCIIFVCSSLLIYAKWLYRSDYLPISN